MHIILITYKFYKKMFLTNFVCFFLIMFSVSWTQMSAKNVDKLKINRFFSKLFNDYTQLKTQKVSIAQKALTKKVEQKLLSFTCNDLQQKLEAMTADNLVPMRGRFLSL